VDAAMLPIGLILKIQQPALLFTPSCTIVFLIQAIHSTFQIKVINKSCGLFMVDV